MSYKDVQRVMARHEDELLAIDGVQGVGIAKDNGDLAITVFVDENENRYRKLLPSKLENVPVRVEESGLFQAF